MCDMTLSYTSFFLVINIVNNIVRVSNGIFYYHNIRVLSTLATITLSDFHTIFNLAIGFMTFTAYEYEYRIF